MDSSRNEEAASPNDDSVEQFQQLLITYVRQVGRRFPADKSVQKAVKNLEKSFVKPR